MKFSTRNLLTKKNLFKKIDSYNIFRAYCANFTRIGRSFSSDLPFRSKKDTNASCRIEYIGGDLLFTDFGEGSYRAIPYVMRKFGLSYGETLSKINHDFGLGLIDNSSNKVISSPIQPIKTFKYEAKEKKPTIIDVKYKDWESFELKYWQQHGWTLEMLKRASIRPIDYFWLTMEHKNIIQHPFSAKNELAFSYDFYRNEGVFRRKLYFPEREHKFTTNVDNTVIQNWDLLSKQGGDTLFITSSKKDSAPFYRIYNVHKQNPQWNVVAPNSEISFLPSKTLYKLKKRFKNIIIYFDNDETGIINAKKLSKLHNLSYLYNPIGAPKDPSDVWKEGGGRLFRNTLLQQANKKNLNLYL